jgi:hypothetical protein
MCTRHSRVYVCGARAVWWVDVARRRGAAAEHRSCRDGRKDVRTLCSTVSNGRGRDKRLTHPLRAANTSDCCGYRVKITKQKETSRCVQCATRLLISVPPPAHPPHPPTNPLLGPRFSSVSRQILHTPRTNIHYPCCCKKFTMEPCSCSRARYVVATRAASHLVHCAPRS